MLTKRNTVQKSYRIEGRLSGDLELLSQKLGRPQNDLINIALNQLMLDNIGWFVEDYLNDMLEDFLSGKVMEKEIVTDNLRFHVINKGDSIRIDYDIKTPSFTESCNNGFYVGGKVGMEMIQHDLAQIALAIGTSSEQIQGYLKERFDYIFSEQAKCQKFDVEKYMDQRYGLEPKDEIYESLSQYTISQEARLEAQEERRKNTKESDCNAD